MFSDTKNLYVALSNGTANIWDKKSLSLDYKLQHSTFRTLHSIASDKNFIFTATSKEIKVWDKKTKVLVVELDCGKGIQSIIIDADYVFVGSSDKFIRIWDKNSWNEIQRLKSTSKITSLCVDDLYVYSGDSKGFITVWKHPLYDQKKKQKETKTTKKSPAKKKQRKKKKLRKSLVVYFSSFHCCRANFKRCSKV